MTERDFTLTGEARWRYEMMRQENTSRAWDWLQAAARIARAEGRPVVYEDDLLAARQAAEQEAAR